MGNVEPELPAKWGQDDVPSQGEHSETQEQRPWILRSKHADTLTLKTAVLGAVLPILVCFTVALVLGLALNYTYTGNATGKSGVMTVDSGGLPGAQSLGDPIHLNALQSSCGELVRAASRCE